MANSWLVQVIANAIAIVISGLAAVWLSQRMQKSQEKWNVKMGIFTYILANRTDITNPGYYNTFNLIDAVYHDDYEVRDAWRAYYESLNDANLNNENGFHIRLQKEIALLTKMAKSLGLNKLSEVDVGHIYKPQAVVDAKESANKEKEETMKVLRLIADLLQKQTEHYTEKHETIQ